MSDEIVKYSNQFNNQALRKFTALDLDLLMAIASRVRDKGTDEVAFTFEELKRLAGLQRNLAVHPLRAGRVHGPALQLRQGVLQEAQAVPTNRCVEGQP